jgi:bisphosphoglycerate-dependent phosphoglycerate mutase
MELALYVFRTGKIKSKNNIFLGWLNLPLDNKGMIEADKVGRKLIKEEIDIGFCSDQLRGKQALVEVLKYHRNAKVVVDHRLRERNYGVFSGKDKELFKKYFSNYPEIHRGYKTNIPKGESLEEVTKRVSPFLKELIKFMQDEKVNVAICAHTNSMRAIEEYMEDLHEDELVVMENSPSNYKKYVLKFDLIDF